MFPKCFLFIQFRTFFSTFCSRLCFQRSVKNTWTLRWKLPHRWVTSASTLYVNDILLSFEHMMYICQSRLHSVQIRRKFVAVTEMYVLNMVQKHNLLLTDELFWLLGKEKVQQMSFFSQNHAVIYIMALWCSCAWIYASAMPSRLCWRHLSSSLDI